MLNNKIEGKIPNKEINDMWEQLCKNGKCHTVNSVSMTQLHGLYDAQKDLKLATTGFRKLAQLAQEGYHIYFLVAQNYGMHVICG